MQECTVGHIWAEEGKREVKNYVTICHRLVHREYSDQRHAQFRLSLEELY